MLAVTRTLWKGAQMNECGAPASNRIIMSEEDFDTLVDWLDSDEGRELPKLEELMRKYGGKSND